MTDNTQINPGAGGDTVRDIDRTGQPGSQAAKTQVVQLDGGGQNGERLVSPATPLPVQMMDGGGTPAQVDPSGNQMMSEINLGQATSSDGPLFISIAGNVGGDFAGVDILEQLVSDNSGLSINAKIINAEKRDINGATVLSDAPAPIQIQIGVGQYQTIDTTGYQSMSVTTQSLAASVTTSDDGITWSALTGTPKILGAYVTAVAANTGYFFPVIARYIRFTGTTAGTATAYLRSAAWNPNYTTSVPTSTASNNVAQFGGTNVVNAGVAGIPSVGGNIAPGVARTANPIPVGGVDASNLTRSLLTDAAGRQYAIVGAVDPAGSSRIASTFGTSAWGAAPAILTQESAQYEGKSVPELLAQILLELQIANQQRHEIMNGANSADDPSLMRADPSIFN